MLQKEKLFLLICLSSASIASAQNFGSSYDFLIKETNARTAALGGLNNALRDDDVQLVFGNPAVANGKMAKAAGFTVNPSFAHILQYNLAYADSLQKLGNVFATLQYVDYGTLDHTDETGYKLGEFGASQYAVTVGGSQKKGNYTLGAGIKFIGFQIFGNNAYASAIDLGVHFQHPRKQLQLGLAVKNVGLTLKKFDGGQRMPLPFNIQATLSYKLEHMPLRLSLSGFYLQETDIQYLDPNAPGTVDANGIEVKESKKITEQIARHLTLGGEFLLHRSFHIRFGYNHLRRKELRPTNVAGLTGFSLGFGINTKNFNLGYTYAGWQPELGQHFISLNCRFGNMFRKSTL